MNKLTAALEVINILNWDIPEKYYDESDKMFSFDTDGSEFIINFGFIEVYNSQKDTLELDEDEGMDFPDYQMIPRIKKVALSNIKKYLDTSIEILNAISEAKNELG